LIKASSIAGKVETALVKANTIMDDKIKSSLKLYTGPFSSILNENSLLAEKLKLPLCQDTGFIEFFVFIGQEVSLEEPLSDTLDTAVRRAYSKNPYRYSIVKDPLIHRENTGDNTPSVVHTFMVSGRELEIRFLVKGGGSENLSRLFMLNPTTSQEEFIETIANSISEGGARGCPPLRVGIGIGGSSEKSMLLAKLALTRELDSKNPDVDYALLEKKLLNKFNSLHIGYQGLGEGMTAYSVSIETAPCHIAILPVSLAVDCYLCRKGVVTFEDR
jgi:fumarate hydratase subunit alpha